MGLLDFFKKGVEKPVEKKPANTPRPAPSTTSNTPGAPRTSAPTQREYVIKSGDSLSKIAKQFYGNAGEWKKIHEANKATIKDPNLIHPGQKIIIP